MGLDAMTAEPGAEATDTRGAPGRWASTGSRGRDGGLVRSDAQTRVTVDAAPHR